jgi:hypothetical protein
LSTLRAWLASIGGVAPRLAASVTELARSPDGHDTVVLLIDGVVRGYHHCDSKGDLSTTHALAVTGKKVPATRNR